ncbi:MAG: hypothetical protein IKE43_10715 [Coriobacteriales bacterium]|nr:hypothetical protein [Coriobacteriales bacterium]
MIETKIYVGLNDSETLEQKFDTLKYVNVLKNVCKNYGIPFSISPSQGGYIHENGQYTEEITLVISMIDVDRETVNEIAKDLCVFFHQESVLITENELRAYFVNETL